MMTAANLKPNAQLKTSDLKQGLEIKQLQNANRVNRDRLEKTKQVNADALVWLRTGHVKEAVEALEKGQAI